MMQYRGALEWMQEIWFFQPPYERTSLPPPGQPSPLQPGGAGLKEREGVILNCF